MSTRWKKRCMPVEQLKVAICYPTWRTSESPEFPGSKVWKCLWVGQWRLALSARVWLHFGCLSDSVCLFLSKCVVSCGQW